MNKKQNNISINDFKILAKPKFNDNEQWKYTNINKFKKIGVKRTDKIIKKDLNCKSSKNEITIINNQAINQSYFSEKLIINNILTTFC